MIDGLKPYDSHQPSGTDHLGEFPSHWRVRRAKVYLREVDERSVTGGEKLLSVSHKTGVTPRREKNVTMFLAESNVGHKVCRPGDVVVNTMWAWMAAVGASDHTGLVSPSYGVYRPRSSGQLDTRFLDELLRTPKYRDEYVVRSTGITSSRLRLYPDQFLKIPLPVPPPDEQVAIVRFLDHADRRIRRYIRAKQKLIKLLEEQKQAIIHQAVTRGLDQTVPMKDSGVPWLDAVPDSWSLRRMWTLARVRKERNPGDLGLLSVFLDRGVIPYAEGGGQVHAPSLDLSRYQVVRPGDFVLNNQQAWRGSVGVSSHYGIISPAYIVLAMSPELDVTFANYLLRSRVMVDQFVVASRGVGDIQRQVYWPHLRSVVVPVPSLAEQQAIARRIEEQTVELARTTDVVRREVDLVRELRTRLIADVVTGQLDVRAAAAALPDEPTDDEPLDDADETGDDDLDADAAPEDDDA